MSFPEYASTRARALLEALRAQFSESALRELDALRKALDARSESVLAGVSAADPADPAALAGLVDDLSQAAAAEAHAAARAARAQALEEAGAQLDAERADWRARLDATQADARAHLGEEAEAKARLIEALEEAQMEAEVARAEAHAQIEAARTEAHARIEAAQTEARTIETQARAEARATVEAERAARIQALEEARGQVESARAEMEAVRAAHAQAVEEVRARIEAAQADARAQIDAARAEAQARIDATRTEVEVARAAETRALEHGQARSEAQAAANPAPVDRLLDAFRAIDRSASLTEVLNALVEQLAAEFPRAALFVVRGDRLQGWRSIGFAGAAADVQTFEIPLLIDSPLTRAVSAARTIVTGDGLDDQGGPVFEGTARRAVSLPIPVGDRVVAVAYADDTGRTGDETVQPARTCNPRVAEGLVLHAARCLSVLAAARTVPPAQVAFPAPVPPSGQAAPADRQRRDDSKRVEEARSYARLLVTEIKRYNEAKVREGHRRKDLYERLKGDIERCRRMYAQHVAPEVRSASNFFDEELVRILADGDATVLGPIACTGTGHPAAAFSSESLSSAVGTH